MTDAVLAEEQQVESTYSDSVHYYYPIATSDGELSKRLAIADVQNGQAAFFSLITRLGIPVLDKVSNLHGGIDYSPVGTGASYSVTQAMRAFSSIRDSQTITRRLESQNNISTDLLKRGFATKRVVVDRSSSTSDGQFLAAITNEVRILGHKSIKTNPFLVKLICIAWDELPTQGRCWPRLLLEAADYGNFADFIAAQPQPISKWNVKSILLLHIMQALQCLHGHGIVHCDIKLENVLIFRDDSAFSVDGFSAKLCDFGFSVITTDYNQDHQFTARIGTEPWNSPELTLGLTVDISDLHKSDIYSLGLLVSRVLMGGGSPFDHMTLQEIRTLKSRLDDDSSTLVYERVSQALFSNYQYSEGQQAMVSKFLLCSLLPKARHRFPLRLLMLEFGLLSLLFPGTGNSTKPETEQQHSLELLVNPAESNDPNMSSRLDQILSAVLQIIPRVVWQPISSILYGLGMFKTWLDQVWIRILLRLEIIKDPWAELFDAPPLLVEPIPRLQSNNLVGEDVLDLDNPSKWDLKDVPDFEDIERYDSLHMSGSTATEVVKDLLQQDSANKTKKDAKSAEIEFQLAVAYFQGIGVSISEEISLQFLSKAALYGSKKAQAGVAPIFASVREEMSPTLTEITQTQLSVLAKHELLSACADLVNGHVRDLQNDIALRQWVVSRPDEYSRHVNGSEFISMKVILLQILWMRDKNSILECQYNFNTLPGFELFSMFDQQQRGVFIEAVRNERCLNKTQHGMTILQYAVVLGDLPLTKILVLDLKAKLESCGQLQGMTPLWLSCFCGHIEITKFLFEQGAKVDCRDSLRGYTPLHLLHQFRRARDILWLLEKCVGKGLKLEGLDHNNNTPLLSTFIGWDFSGGYAARLLLKVGANVAAKSRGKWYPLVSAVNKFDVNLACAIVEACKESGASRATLLDSSETSIEEQKTLGLQQLLLLPSFYRRRLLGVNYGEVLQQLVDLLLDKQTLHAFATSKHSRGLTPLIAACFTGDDDLALALLKTPFCPPVNERTEYSRFQPDDNRLPTALHWAVERNRPVSVMNLVSYGADPLITTQNDENIFHRAAKFAPSLLVHLLDHLEAGRISLDPLLEAREVVRLPCQGGFNVFALAVMEGTPEHLMTAEVIRVRYKIDHDEAVITAPNDPSTQTLLAYVITSAVSGNLFVLEQVEYLVNIGPGPKFVASKSDNTLLHFAVMGFQFSEFSSNPTGYAALRLLLRNFPSQDHLYAPNDQGLNSIHYAVMHANIVALEIIQDHLLSRGETIDVNRTSLNIPPPLSMLGWIRNSMGLKEEDEPLIHKLMKQNEIRVLRFMREHGACTADEKNRHIMTAIFPHTQDNLPKASLLRFLQIIKSMLEIDWHLTEDELPASAANTIRASWVVELCWTFDRFHFLVCQMLQADISAHIGERGAARLRLTRGGREYPWMTLDREDHLHGEVVKWRRPGRTWTSEERKNMTNIIGAVWRAMFPDEELRAFRGRSSKTIWK